MIQQLLTGSMNLLEKEIDDYCHIKVQGNSLRRELVLTKDSAIVPNLDQFHVLGDLDEVCLSIDPR
jgi:hypothetical protein